MSEAAWEGLLSRLLILAFGAPLAAVLTTYVDPYAALVRAVASSLGVPHPDPVAWNFWPMYATLIAIGMLLSRRLDRVRSDLNNS